MQRMGRMLEQRQRQTATADGNGRRLRTNCLTHRHTSSRANSHTHRFFVRCATRDSTRRTQSPVVVSICLLLCLLLQFSS